MVFSSLFFIYVFLALHLLIYSFCRHMSAKNIVLLVSSLIFYSWSGPRYLLILVGMTFVSWFCARMMENSRKRRQAKGFLITGCTILLVLLGIFKYTGFILTGVQFFTGLPRQIPDIVLPIGISFYTFQLISYMVDVYRKEVPAQKKFWLLLLYASLFHQCIAGPIVRYRHVARDITRRKVTLEERAEGVKRFTVGLAKKALLANTCASMVDNLLPSDLAALSATPALGLWLGALCFMLEIYLDFSAYSDMAIGMGRMVGFHYQENFNYPYMASSVTDFWRRWHISLSSFFRDYVYIPLGGNRRGQARTIFNLFVVWGLTGMWHGASWNFVLWGLYYFVFLVLEKLVLHSFLDRHRWVVARIYTLLVVYFGWILFHFEDFTALGRVCRGLFGLNGNGWTGGEVTILFQNQIFFLILAVFAVTPGLSWIRNKLLEFHKIRGTVPYEVYLVELLAPPTLLVLSTMALVGNSYNPFLYFQF